MSAADRSETTNGAPAGGWTALIDDLVDGRWVSPISGETAPPAPFEKIVIGENLDGIEFDLVQALRFGADSYKIVTDERTYEAMGRRINAALGRSGKVEVIVLPKPHADMATVENLRQRLGDGSVAIAVGAGSLNDITKYATFLDGRRYCVFPTSASMNGYTSSTASITLDSGLKVSMPAQAPAGVFVDLQVSADAPSFLAASGFGDCLCRSVAQIDWWMSHRLLGTAYWQEPYIIELPDEAELNKRAHQLPRSDVAATGYLHRVLTLCGLGISFTKVSNHGSMGEHQISHYIDCFAGERHSGSLHGQQVGVASLTMARIQRHFLEQEQPPVLQPTQIDAADMARRMGDAVAEQCLAEYRKKALDESGAAALNAKLAEIWPSLRDECLAMALPVDEMRELLSSAGGATTAEGLGLDPIFYREAVRHAHEMRNRYSFTDIACDSGVLDELVDREG